MTRPAYRRRAWGLLALPLLVVIPLVSRGPAARTVVLLGAGDPPPQIWYATPTGLATQNVAAATAGAAPAAVKMPCPQTPCGDDPVAVNSDGSRLIAGLWQGQINHGSEGVAVINPQTRATIGTIPPDADGEALIAVAMDPTNPAVAWAVEACTFDFCQVEEAHVIRIDLDTLNQTVWSTLPLDLSGVAVSPNTAAISPDGSRLYVGWGGQGNATYYGVDAVPLTSGPNPAVPVWQQRGATTGQNGPPSPNNSSNGSDRATVTDVAVSPDGSRVYVAILGPALRTPYAGAIVQLPGNLNGKSVAQGQQLLPPNILALAEPFALAVSPDGQTLYAGGVASQNPNGYANAGSFINSYNANGLAPKSSLPVNIGAGLDPSGITSMAISPDGRTLTAFGFDENSDPNQTVAYTVALPSFSVTGPRITINGTIPAEDYAPGYGPQDVVFSPDQAPVARLAPAAASAGAAVVLDAGPSSVAFGSIIRYAWSFGDGTSAVTTSPAVSHTYTAPSAGYLLRVTETDSAGVSLPPAPFSARAVETTGKTPYLDAGPSAQTSEFVPVSPKGTPPPSIPGHTTIPNVTTTTAPGTPTLKLNPTVGAPGTIVAVTGSGFAHNSTVTVKWSLGGGNSASCPTDAGGNLNCRLPVLVPDVFGPRNAVTATTPPAQASFLVVPGTSEPGGDSGSELFRTQGGP